MIKFDYVILESEKDLKGCFTYMKFQCARTELQITARKNEIINACKDLYLTLNYEAVNIKAISKATSISRPSIYNYYHTKEEILLDLLLLCYLEFGSVLKEDFENTAVMTKKDFSYLLAKRLSEHDLMLRLTSIHYTNLEQNCSQEKLNEFKQKLQPFFDIFANGIAKFFPDAPKKLQNNFRFLFFSLINGLYPMTHPAEKQRIALQQVISGYIPPDFQEMSAIGIYALLHEF